MGWISSTSTVTNGSRATTGGADDDVLPVNDLVERTSWVSWMYLLKEQSNIKHRAQSPPYLYSFQLLWWSKDDLCPAVSSVSDSFPPLCNCQSQTPCRTLSCTSHWAPHSRPVETPRTRLSDLSSPDHNADWPAWAELFLYWFNKVYIGEPFITPRLFHDLHRLNPRLPPEIMFL